VFHHVAVFRWAPGTTPDVTALAADLNDFARSLAGVRSYACGVDAGIRDGSADFAVSASFETEEALRDYLDNPTHHAIVAERLTDAVGERHSVQFQSS
jgi:hypothetical protein